MSKHLLLQLRKELAAAGDPEKAVAMQAYMKSAMAYHGVVSPAAKVIFKNCFANLEFESSQDWQEQVLAIWRQAKFREERYAALALAGHKDAREYQIPSAVKMYEEMITNGAWWDYVDDIAIHKIGPIVGTHPNTLHKKMLAWSKCSDLWKRRTSIICQIQLKEKMDLDLLYACIEPSISSSEFFLRKGIGWALRQVAWRNPQEIIRYVRKNRDRLSPLSKREALKNVIRAGAIEKIP